METKFVFLVSQHLGGGQEGRQRYKTKQESGVVRCRNLVGLSTGVVAATHFGLLNYLVSC